MSIDFRPIAATLGAEVSGANMANVDRETLDQSVAVEEHVVSGRLFGDREIYRRSRTGRNGDAKPIPVGPSPCGENPSGYRQVFGLYEPCLRFAYRGRGGYRR